VVIPNMPGYGFSGKPTSTGWGPDRIARAWVVLMQRLGYSKFVAQGGDWGAVVVDLMGLLAPPELLGIHTNMPGVYPAEIDGAAYSGAPAPASLSADEKLAYERLQFVYQKGIGYGYQMGLRPQTLYGIADSPVGLAAYFLDHDARSLALIARVFDGESEGLTRDDILDNITIAWLTNTGDFRRSSLLGILGQGVFQCQRCLHPGCRERLPRRTLSGSAELDRAGLSQPDPLQPAAQGRTFRRLGAAEVHVRGNARGLQLSAQVAKSGVCTPRRLNRGLRRRLPVYGT
jgi:pimeloyl-ACP methyl ester carboxylesterase